MGNFFSFTRKKKFNSAELQDSQRLLMFENIDEKIETLEQNMSVKYSNMVMTYNKEINSLRIEICNLNKENEIIARKVNNLNVLISDKENKILNLQNKIYSMESQDEFLSTIGEEEADATEFISE